ncbi:MAG: hypothetical protein MJ003_01580 [Paludibacteraceae bacterium]|nr:hypothetical protein [Paludibacteraceae bacterium]
METMQTDLKFKDKQPAFEKMQKLSELSAMTKAESDQYFWEQDYYRTIKNADGYERELGEKQGREEGLAEGLKEGRKQGHEQGLEEGLELGKLSVAKNMKQEGLDAILISKVTGLSADEISKL